MSVRVLLAIGRLDTSSTTGPCGGERIVVRPHEWHVGTPSFVARELSGIFRERGDVPNNPASVSLMAVLPTYDLRDQSTLRVDKIATSISHILSDTGFPSFSEQYGKPQQFEEFTDALEAVPTARQASHHPWTRRGNATQSIHMDAHHCLDSVYAAGCNPAVLESLGWKKPFREDAIRMPRLACYGDAPFDLEPQEPLKHFFNSLEEVSGQELQLDAEGKPYKGANGNWVKRDDGLYAAVVIDLPALMPVWIFIEEEGRWVPFSLSHRPTFAVSLTEFIMPQAGARLDATGYDKPYKRAPAFTIAEKDSSGIQMSNICIRPAYVLVQPFAMSFIFDVTGSECPAVHVPNA
ncbi:hypothetical protein T492DRAFT_835680 [Pavlovales sp. CCMP2436]|nr:hypothetical protein T492DRAFT_835680 [Pavlovales sp. CCMP2436]